MTSLRDVLKASKGLPVRDPMAAVWGRKIAARNAVGETESTLPIMINTDGSALLDYRIYGNTIQGGTPTPENPIVPEGVGERTRNIIDVYSASNGNKISIAGGLRFDFLGAPQCITINGQSNGVYPQIQIWGENGVLQLENGKTYTGLIKTTNKPKDSSVYMIIQGYDAEGNWSTIKNIYSDSVGINFSVSNDYVDYRYVFVCQNSGITYDNMKAYLMIVEGSASPETYEPYGYKLPILSNSTVTNIYIGDTPLEKDEYVSYSEQAAYHKSVPDDVRARFEQENQVTFADPEAVVHNGNRVRTVVTAVLGEGYTCKEIGTVFSNTDGLCKNDDLFLYRADGLTIKKASYTDGRTTRSSNTLDSGFGVKSVGFATISDGTYTTTIYTRILYATYERLHDLGDFTAYPPNTGQNFVPTAVTLPEIPTSEGVTVIDCDMTPKPGKMYVKYRR